MEISHALVETVLLVVCSLLALLVGALLHMVHAVGKEFDGFLAGLTRMMGPGTVHSPRRVFPLHAFPYLMSAAFMIASVLRAAL